MITTYLDGDVTQEEFKTEAEYNHRLLDLQKIMGRNKIFYHGWLNSQLVIMYWEKR